MDKDDEKRDEVLKRLLKTPPKPKLKPKASGTDGEDGCKRTVNDSRRKLNEGFQKD